MPGESDFLSGEREVLGDFAVVDARVAGENEADALSPEADALGGAAKFSNIGCACCDGRICDCRFFGASMLIAT